MAAIEDRAGWACPACESPEAIAASWAEVMVAVPVMLILLGAVGVDEAPWLAKACMPRMPTARAATRTAIALRLVSRAAICTHRELRVRRLVAGKGLIGFDATEKVVSGQPLGPQPERVDDDADRGQGHCGCGDHG
ncbi:hypothetical protein GCM10009606_08280 [Nocardioides aquiterrae]|uniref:Uncharacterized protein n=1 Tax=Nocardioides aquiterrae TaxID=203799 RepID=A0ABN1UA06_9ACTN